MPIFWSAPVIPIESVLPRRVRGKRMAIYRFKLCTPCNGSGDEVSVLWNSFGQEQNFYSDKKALPIKAGLFIERISAFII